MSGVGVLCVSDPAPLPSFHPSGWKVNSQKFVFMGILRSLLGVGVPSSSKIASSTTMEGMTVQPNEITEVLNRPLSQELLARDVTRLAYVAKDGTPRTCSSGVGPSWTSSMASRTSISRRPAPTR